MQRVCRHFTFCKGSNKSSNLFNDFMFLANLCEDFMNYSMLDRVNKFADFELPSSCFIDYEFDEFLKRIFKTSK